MLKISTVFSFCCMFLAVHEMSCRITEDDLSKVLNLLRPIADVCLKEVNGTQDDFTELVITLPASTRSSRCLRACLARKIGLVDKEGMLVRDVAVNLGRTAVYHIVKTKREREYHMKRLKIAIDDSIKWQNERQNKLKEWSDCIKVTDTLSYFYKVSFARGFWKKN